MLQRAASNAYSWWWASHIRTKQSKWLEQSLQDMEEKTQYMLKLIEEDGDSFAKRAEMYYKKRPELINFVEESYRAFRALAERYDHLSTELQNANNTIATLFPDQMQLMDEEDDYTTPKVPKVIPQFPISNPSKVPKVPKAPIKDWKGLISASKQLKPKKPKAEQAKKTDTKSGLSKTEALEEIDKLQKDILGLQTVKEFVKSSYQTGLSKYWGIENQIVEMQQRVCSLRDEFSVNKVIDDDEARTLMAEAALKSCQETLAQLQEKQERSNEEARKEYKKIEDARKKLKSIRREFLNDQSKDEEEDKEDEKHRSSRASDVSENSTKEAEKMKEKQEKGMEEIEMGSFTVSKLADKIDELVNKVISLETAVTSQTVLIDRLRTEADDLHVQIRVLEGDKATLIDDTHNLNIKVQKMEEKLQGIQDLNHNVEKQNNHLQSNFAEARSSLDHLSEKLNSVKPDEEIQVATYEENEDQPLESTTLKQEDPEGIKALGSGETINNEREEDNKAGKKTAKFLDGIRKGKIEEPNATQKDGSEEQKQAKAAKVTKDGSEEQKETKEIKEAKVTKGGSEEKKEGKETKDGSEEHKETKEAKVTKDGSEEQKEAKEVKETKDGSEEQKEAKEAKVTKDGSEEKKETKAGSEEQEETKEAKETKTGSEEQKEAKEPKEFNWQQMLLSGMEDKEKILLTEYTTILRNYKDTKKKLGDMEKKDRDHQFELALQIRELKITIAKRDEEIQHLRKRLNSLQGNSGEEIEIMEDDRSLKPGAETEDFPSSDKEDEEIKLILMDEPQVISQVEEKLRTDIDGILDENLDFWLRFSTSFHQVQKFKTTVHDLQREISRLKVKKKQEDSTGDLKSEVRATFKHLKEIQTELTVWLEQSVLLKDELERRFTSLCNIQDRITTALNEGVEEEEIRFSSHQAAKFQGEILNMKQENNKVKEELQAGVHHIKTLQGEIEKSLRMLDAEFELSGIQPQLRHTASRSRIPLRSFIFGTKLKKQKHSLFPFTRKYQALRAGLPM